MELQSESVKTIKVKIRPDPNFFKLVEDFCKKSSKYLDEYCRREKDENYQISKNNSNEDYIDWKSLNQNL